MLVMRPARMTDLAEVQRLAADSPVGVTSLPDNWVRQISPWKRVWLRKRPPRRDASASTNQNPAL